MGRILGWFGRLHTKQRLHRHIFGMIRQRDGSRYDNRTKSDGLQSMGNRHLAGPGVLHQHGRLQRKTALYENRFDVDGLHLGGRRGQWTSVYQIATVTTPMAIGFWSDSYDTLDQSASYSNLSVTSATSAE